MRKTLFVLAFAAMASAWTGAQTKPVVPTAYYRTFSHSHPVFKRIRAGDVIFTQTIDASGRVKSSYVPPPVFVA